MVYDAYMYGDPCRILERKQEEEARKHRNCGRCAFKRVQTVKGKPEYSCAKGKEYGTPKCRYFKFNPY